MTAIPWKNEFETGIMSVDHDHDSLIQAINSLCERLESDLSEVAVLRQLDEIHALIEAHFAAEEKTMIDTDYSGYADHKQDHDRLLNDILDIMDQVKSGKSIDWVSLLGNLTAKWFSVHFSTLDKAFHLQTHGAGNNGS
ncbi:MAG: bacteriohemerythrin [Rhodospirillales bacterium]|nr:bacteriohemerythrin [Rhodospirillales bacterium]